MLYTEKEKHEIERVKEVFAEHLRQSPDFELLWSDKVGYVWLTIGVNPVYVDAAEEAVPGTRQKVLSGEVKSTAAEIASVARAPPEERPALVAEICKPKPPKPPAQKQKAPPAVAAPLPNASTSEEECTDEELVHTPAPQEQTFPQRVNEPLKIDRQQILKIANSRYVPKRLADGTAMLCEVSGAANSMMRRWESVFREYPDILSDAENRASVERTIQKLRDYLKNLENKMEELL